MTTDHQYDGAELQWPAANLRAICDCCPGKREAYGGKAWQHGPDAPVDQFVMGPVSKAMVIRNARDRANPAWSHRSQI